MSSSKTSLANGGAIGVESSAIEKLRSSLRGSLLFPGDEDYDKARTVWNATVDRRPAMVIRCAGASDIRKAVEFGREHNFLIAIKGGGHNIAGNAVCDGGLLIDLSGMRSVTVDPEARVARVEPGVTLAEFDRECQEFGLATPVGINSTTGLAGLTLGGGFGWLSRKYGMTVDNLLSADVITADGRLLHTSKKENADLFWAIRGGSGNFGVVSQFEFKLHPVGPEILGGLVVYSLKEAPSALRMYRDYIKKMGDEMSVWAVLRKAPPLPFLPPSVHGTEVVVFCVFYCGDPNKGQEKIQPIRQFGTVLGEHIGTMPYTAWQQAFDPLLTPGARNYWKSHNFSTLKDEAIDVAIRNAQNLPSPQCEIFFGLIGEATTRPGKDATAYAHRDTLFVCNVHGRWENPADDARCTEWARGFYRDAAPYATGSVYINFITDDEKDRIKAAYGPGYERLVSIKQKYDPENLFRMNQNIRPD